MRLLVLGASGGCGRWVTRIAAERGHEVTALVRDAGRWDPSSGIATVRGAATDASVLDAVVPGHDAILSCLGQRRAGRNPWAPLRSPADLALRVAALLVRAMETHGVRRLVAISAGGVAESRAQLTWLTRRLVSSGNIAVAYRDLAAMESTLAASSLDWLVVRPVTLVDGPPTGRAREVTRYGMASTVRRSDVATWMLDAAERPGVLAQRRVLLGT